MASVLGRLGLFSRPLVVFGRQLLRQGQERHCSATCPSEGTRYTKDYLQSLVKDKPLVLFMKGEPSAPMCGFSRLVVQILHMHGVEDYPYYNMLDDLEFKEAVKEFSNWPTFPQVYMDGELVGGADIMLQMHQSGELIGELEKVGHQSILDKSEKADKS